MKESLLAGGFKNIGDSLLNCAVRSMFILLCFKLLTLNMLFTLTVTN